MKFSMHIVFLCRYHSTCIYNNIITLMIKFTLLQVENVVLVDLDHNSVMDDKLETKLPRLPSEAVQTFKAR